MFTVLQHIMQFGNAVDWDRMMQVCKTWQPLLQTHPNFTYLRRREVMLSCLQYDAYTKITKNSKGDLTDATYSYLWRLLMHRIRKKPLAPHCVDCMTPLIVEVPQPPDYFISSFNFSLRLSFWYWSDKADVCVRCLCHEDYEVICRQQLHSRWPHLTTEDIRSLNALAYSSGRYEYCSLYSVVEVSEAVKKIKRCDLNDELELTQII